jgi:hypothetical protein
MTLPIVKHEVKVSMNLNIGGSKGGGFLNPHLKTRRGLVPINRHNFHPTFEELV